MPGVVMRGQGSAEWVGRARRGECVSCRASSCQLVSANKLRENRLFRRTAAAAAPAAGETAQPPAAVVEQGQGGGDVEMADAAAPPPAKLQRRTGGPSTRQQQLLALAEAAAVVTATGEGSGTRSQTDAHEGVAIKAEPQQTAQPPAQQLPQQEQHPQGQDQQPSSSSHSAGSRRQDVAQPPRPSAAHSMRSSGSNGAGLDCSMGQVRRSRAGEGMQLCSALVWFV